MADLIRTAQYFKVNIADKSGTLAHMLAPLQDAGAKAFIDSWKHLLGALEEKSKIFA